MAEQLLMDGGPAQRAPGNPSEPVTATRRVLLALDRKITYQLLTFVLFASIWQAYGVFRGGLLIPTFTETVVGLGDLLLRPELWAALYLSNQALFIGFAVSVLVGVPLGILLGRFETLERYTDVYLNILLVTPMAALIPLLVMSVGFGLLSRVILVTVFALVLIVVTCRAGVRQIDARLIEMARSFGASEADIWKKILLPGALPAIMTGIRLGLGRAVTGMVIVELLMVSVGVGGLILRFRGLFQPALLYATIIIILAEALILVNIAKMVERKATPWATTAAGRGL